MSSVYVLAMETPGRYIVGESEGLNAQGHITLHTAAHVTSIDKQWSFQHVSLLDEFTADIRAYAGFGKANAECEGHYRTWKKYITNPPDFGVQDDE